LFLLDKSNIQCYIWTMIDRNIQSTIKKYSREYPVIAVVGPRQSGKTTLVKNIFRNYKYISLESIDNRERAISDPRGFLDDCGSMVILDEIQRTPDLFSYLQEYVDRNNKPAQYILTGSHQFLLMEKISQSLAGRIITFKLFPFTMNELYFNSQDQEMANIYTPKKRDVKNIPKLEELILKGMYPPIHDKNLTSSMWIQSYLETYVERDVRAIINIGDTRSFENFIKTIAGNSGQLINYSAISNRIGVSQPTVKRWLSILEASGIIFILQPHYKSFSKRLVKTPKLFFIDTALLCYLLSIKTSTQLKTHPLYGNIFETFIISEIFKRVSHMGIKPDLFFWRDKTGNEIDLLIENGMELIPIEIKLSKTFSLSYFEGIQKWLNLQKNTCKRGIVLYTGDSIIGSKKPLSAYPWYQI